MEKNYQNIYLSVVKQRTEQAINCIKKMNSHLDSNIRDIDNFFLEAEYFLHHASAISFLLWPSPKHNEIAQKRAEHLRGLLNVDDNDVLKDRGLRNHLVHFDERLDAWVNNSARHNFIDKGILEKEGLIQGVDPCDYMRIYIMSTKIYRFGKDSFDIEKMICAIAKIRDNIICNGSNLI